jgi:iron(III) transport system substrate-binding protein
MRTITKAIVLCLMPAILAPAARAQSADWQKTWNETLAAAKQEGKVVVIGSPDPVMRNEVIPKFTQRFGISVDFIAGESAQSVGRLRTERLSGIYSADVLMAGTSTTLNILLPEKMIDPLKPLLILPEVTDGSKWKSGKPSFADREQQYVFMSFGRVDGFMFLNTDYVKREEIRAFKDLLDPKWQGKISSEDPTANGRGISRSGQLFHQFGADFVKKLYIDQKPQLSRNRRQLTDWLARGTAPICLTCRADDAADLQKEGYKLYEVFDLTDAKNLLDAQPFLLSYANRAPHPNAARVFINWLVGKEGLEIYSRGYDAPTLRTDMDESFLDPRTIPKPGVAYQDDIEPEWATTGRRLAGEKVRELLGGVK